MISSGCEGDIYEAFKDGKRFLTKKGMNPADNKDLDYKGIVREYQSYMKEIESARLLDHVNLAKFEEAFRDKNGNLFTVLEQCEDSLYYMTENTLDDNKHLDENILLGILKQICEVLNYLHEKKIAQRDIHPKIILVKSGIIKLVNFG